MATKLRPSRRATGGHAKTLEVAVQAAAAAGAKTIFYVHGIVDKPTRSPIRYLPMLAAPHFPSPLAHKDRFSIARVVTISRATRCSGPTHALHSAEVRKECRETRTYLKTVLAE